MLRIGERIVRSSPDMLQMTSQLFNASVREVEVLECLSSNEMTNLVKPKFLRA